MSSYKEERRLDWIVCGILIIAVILILNFLFYRQDPIAHKEHIGTLTYKVYYTNDHVVEKKVSGIYGFSLSTYRGSNSLNVHKRNVSTWVPVFKHVGLMEGEVSTTAPIEVVSFTVDY